VSELSPADPGPEPATTTEPEIHAQDLAPEVVHRSRLLKALGTVLAAVGTAFFLLQLYISSRPGAAPAPWIDLMLNAIVLAAGVATIWLARSERLSLAAWVIVVSFLFAAALKLYVEGRPDTDLAGRLGLLSLVALAFVLLDRAAAWAVFGISAVTLVGMHVLWLNGYLPPPVARDEAGQVVFSIVIWLSAATPIAVVLYSTMSVLRDQARSLRQRVRDLTLLRGIGNQIAQTLDLEDVLATAVRALQSTFGYESVVILTVLREPDRLTARAAAGKHADLLPEDHSQRLSEGLIGWVATRGESVLVNDVGADPRYVNHYRDKVSTQSEIGVPILIADEVVGVLDVQSDRLDAFSEADRRTLETLAGQIALAMENARLYAAERAARDQLRDLVSYIQAAQEDERTHIAREILDEFGQLMAGLQMNLAWLRQRLTKSQGALTEKTHTMANIIDESIHVVRRLSGELRPSVLDHFGLVAAIRWQADAFAERTGITPQLRLDLDTDLVDPKLSTALFRILQEALSNVVLHAEATQVFIRLRLDEQRVALIVQDDGRGIMPEEADGARSLGLVGMRERARALGGDVTIDGIPGRGTTVTATIPRSEAQEHTYRGA